MNRTLNWKCPICEKFVWLFQKKEYTEATPDTLIVWHRKCHEDASSEETAK